MFGETFFDSRNFQQLLDFGATFEQRCIDLSISVKNIDAKQGTGCLEDKYVARCCSMLLIC